MGKLIAFEGIDGSGKTSQIRLLAQALAEQGSSVAVRSYPAYTSFFGSEIRRLLTAGVEHECEGSDPKSMALWYALDRWLDHRHNIQCFDGPEWVLLNRYTLSTVVFQSVRHGPESTIADWVDTLEHDILGLPRPHLYIVLDISPI